MGYKDILLPRSQEEIWEAIHNLSKDEMLYRCVKGGFLPGVKTAVKNGAEINLKRNNTSLLYDAALSGYEDIIAFLLKRGAEPCFDTLVISASYPSIFKKMLQYVNPQLLKTQKFDTIYKTTKYKGLRELRSIIEERLNMIIH